MRRRAGKSIIARLATTPGGLVRVTRFRTGDKKCIVCDIPSYRTSVTSEVGESLIGEGKVE
jgi:hypothetical protein